jgi:hypothetical protein
MFVLSGPRVLQTRMVGVACFKSLLISCMRACKARAPSHSTAFLFYGPVENQCFILQQTPYRAIGNHF